ncbi:MAG TPA: hypothetical protein VEA35_12825 [Ramlibacter sp.]|nr:hypothetical protein [Ramlibacter sp.]
MKPRIVFGVMSAVTPAGTVDQLARALAPHTVLVHHDFSQRPDFVLTAPNVRFVENPKRTGWATFGFVDGIFHTLAFADEHLDFDYFQLLSPTCLPIRPLAEFEQHVSGQADAHFASIDLLADPDCLMWVGYRAFTPDGSLRHRALRRLSVNYFRGMPGRRDEGGVWLRSGWRPGLDGLFRRLAVKAFSLPWLGRHPFDESFRPYYGSVWFGARRHVARRMVEIYRRPGVRDYFSRLRIAEEFLIPTLLKQAAHCQGPFHHYVNKFIEAHPSKISEAEIPTLVASGAFFARKFPEDPANPVRARVLEELVHGPQRTLAREVREAVPVTASRAAETGPRPLDAGLSPAATTRAMRSA